MERKWKFWVHLVRKTSAQVPYFDELGLKSSAAMCQDFDNLILDLRDYSLR